MCGEKLNSWMENPFTKHPNSINETYFEHMKNALRFVVVLKCLALAGIIHSIFPFWFEKTVSNGIKELNHILEKRNCQQRVRAIILD